MAELLPSIKKKLKKVLTYVSLSGIVRKSRETRQTHTHDIEKGILAQLGEHLPYKQRVTGSSPVGPITVSFH